MIIFTMNEDKKQKDSQIDIPKVTGDFQCSVCGAIFSTDEDSKATSRERGSRPAS